MSNLRERDKHSFTFMKRFHLHLSKIIKKSFASGILKKHSPALDDASRAMLMIYESGIVE